MNQIKDIIVKSNRKHKVILTNAVLADFPPFDDISEIQFVDHNGQPYIFRKLQNTLDPAIDAVGDQVSCESLSVDLNDIKEIFVKLTDDQRIIVMHIYYMYKNNKKSENNGNELSEENPKIILQGPAGTGKSTIINFIEKLITWEENKTSYSPQNLKVLKCAFTGKAASNIEGLTLNYIFSIPIHKTRSLNKKKLASKKELFKDCIFFICDEISMVGEAMMSSVNSRLQQIFDNDKLYGGRFVLLVGDLYQIDPVKQKPVYPKSEFWTCCEFYELTKIIRQHDAKFINALNNFRDSQMRDEDIELLRSRIENIDDVPDSVIHLFYLNKHVDEHNTLIINNSDEKEEIVNTIEEDDWEPSNLRVKIGIKYMITYNMDVADGLANGTTGVVKDFDYDKDGVNIIWMEFHSDKVGRKTREEYFSKKDKPGFEKYVPIKRSKIVVKRKSNPNVTQTVGNMFPLRAAEAITVHKSQGQTYHEGVCVHITTDPYDKLRTDKTLQYVALTRVKRLEDLFIAGPLDFNVLKSKKFIRTENELNRLRNEKKLKIAYETFEDKTGDVIVYLNTDSTFNDHHQFIASDNWYKNASLLIFTETKTVASDKIEIPDFEMAFCSDNKTVLRSGGGMICYKKSKKSLEVVSSHSDENKMYLTLFLYDNSLYIITGVKGDREDNFKRVIITFMVDFVQKKRCLLMIGNLNANDIDFLNNFNFKNKLTCAITTADNVIKNDVVFTRNLDIKKNNTGFYQYIPSSHRPMYVILPDIGVNVTPQTCEPMEID